MTSFVIILTNSSVANQRVTVGPHNHFHQHHQEDIYFIRNMCLLYNHSRKTGMIIANSIKASSAPDTVLGDLLKCV